MSRNREKKQVNQLVEGVKKFIDGFQIRIISPASEFSQLIATLRRHIQNTEKIINKANAGNELYQNALIITFSGSFTPGRRVLASLSQIVRNALDNLPQTSATLKDELQQLMVQLEKLESNMDYKSSDTLLANGLFNSYGACGPSGAAKQSKDHPPAVAIPSPS